MEEPSIRLDLVALVRRLMDGEYASGEECEGLIDQLLDRVLDPQITDYIFWPDRPMTPEEVIDRALAYQPRVASYTPD